MRPMFRMFVLAAVAASAIEANEVADQVGLAEARRDLDCAGKRDDLRAHAVACEIGLEYPGIRRRDPLAVERLRTVERDSIRHAER